MSKPETQKRPEIEWVCDAFLHDPIAGEFLINKKQPSIFEVKHRRGDLFQEENP